MNDNVKRLRSGAIERHIGAGKKALFSSIPLILALIWALIWLIFPLKPPPAQGAAPKIVPANHIGMDSDSYRSPVHLCNLENQSVKESSGIAASRLNTDIFWT